MLRSPPDVRARAAILLVAAVILPSCGDDVDPARPDLTLEPIVDPTERITQLETLEELSETVANLLITFFDDLKNGDLDKARPFLADDFVGHDLGSAIPTMTRDLPLGVTEASFDGEPAVVDKEGFLAGVTTYLADYEFVGSLAPKTKGAEFSLGHPTHGALTVKLSAIGATTDGGPLARQGMLRVAVTQDAGRWTMTRLAIESMTEQRRSSTIFTDVARSAGVALETPQFGKDGEPSFFWNGAASYDVDGDGRYDIFVPSKERNFLYRNAGDGTFEEIAESVGLDQPPGGTGALFFDADADGDADLLLAQVGFKQRGDVIGRTSAFFVQGDDGSFVEKVDAGFDELLVAFSLAAADVDQDGHVDVYVCSYNAEGMGVAPNSWHAADNGTRNALYLNNGDNTFENVAAAAGVDDIAWSYAAAFADFDEDGDQDLYVANDYGPNRLYVNNGDLTFTDRAAELGVEDVGNGMGATWGDEDGDGDLDLYVSNMSSSAGNRILKRLSGATIGDGGADEGGITETLFKLAAGNSIFRWDGDRFTRLPAADGGISASWAWAAQYVDIELDGDEDLICVNGFVSGDGGGAFKDT